VEGLISRGKLIIAWRLYRVIKSRVWLPIESEHREGLREGLREGVGVRLVRRNQDIVAPDDETAGRGDVAADDVLNFVVDREVALQWRSVARTVMTQISSPAAQHVPYTALLPIGRGCTST